MRKISLHLFRLLVFILVFGFSPRSSTFIPLFLPHTAASTSLFSDTKSLFSDVDPCDEDGDEADEGASAKRFHNQPRFPFWRQCFSGGVQLKNVLVFSRQKWHWHDMEMSEHGVYTPKRFTICPGLTTTKVRIWGPKPSRNVEKIKQPLL